VFFLRPPLCGDPVFASAHLFREKLLAPSLYFFRLRSYLLDVSTTTCASPGEVDSAAGLLSSLLSAHIFFFAQCLVPPCLHLEIPPLLFFLAAMRHHSTLFSRANFPLFFFPSHSPRSDFCLVILIGLNGVYSNLPIASHPSSFFFLSKFGGYESSGGVHRSDTVLT